MSGRLRFSCIGHVQDVLPTLLFSLYMIESYTSSTHLLEQGQSIGSLAHIWISNFRRMATFPTLSQRWKVMQDSMLQLPTSSVSMVDLEFHMISFALVETSVSLILILSYRFLLRTKNLGAILAVLTTKELLGS